MRYKKYIKVAFGWAMRLFVFVFLGPVVALYCCILRCGLAAQIRRLEGKQMAEKDAGDGKKAPLEFMELSSSEELDFMKNRSRTYINQITFGSLREISNFASRRRKISLVPNYVLHHVLFNSLFSYGLAKEENPHSEVTWRFSFSEMGEYKFFREFSWDVKEILVLKTGKLNILDRSGKVHTPRCRTWPLAKAHVQAQLTFFAPGLARNHVHLVLPSIIAREARKGLPETSTLRQLLEPHTRFTQYVNTQALQECLSPSTSKRLCDCLLRPWLTMPTSDTDFMSGIKKKCEQYHVAECSLVPNLNDDIPYQSFLKEYYKIFRDFVRELTPLLKNDYEVLRTAIIEYVPLVARESMTDVLAAFLWNSCIVYHSDHESYLRQWARSYGCMAVRTPLVKVRKHEDECDKVSIETISNGQINQSFVEDSDSVNTNNNHTVIEIHRYSSKEDGSKFFSSFDVCRARCFFQAFVQYNENTTVNMKLFDTEYNFTDPAATKASVVFLTELKDLSSKLKQRGEAIVKGEDFLKSICY